MKISTRSHGSVALLALCIVILTIGLFQLFKFRFERGDIYPAYSSLRSDPLGTMAFYESLDRLPGVTATRDFTPANRLPDGKDTTYLHTAASVSEWQILPDDAVREIDRFLASGGRLVITLRPRSAADPWRNRQVARTNSAPGSLGKDSMPFMSGHWGVGFEVRDLAENHDGSYVPAIVGNESGLPLPETLSWHSGIVCSPGDAWRTLYARGTDAVVIERAFGRGSVVIATDSYFLSNEALLLDRHADFLTWIIGSSRRVFFDEAHLGVTESPGVVALMRRYRLHGLAAGLALLAGLFLWKNASSLVPRQSGDEGEQEALAGKDAAAGFVNLLRRNIPRSQVLATCFQEWKASAALECRHSAARRQQAESIYQAHTAARSKNPVATYQAISRSLQDRTPKAPIQNVDPKS